MPVTQIAFRTQKTIGITECYPEYDSLSGFSRPTGNLRCCTYSPDGQFFAYASAEGVTIVNPDTGAVVTRLDVPNVLEVGFSPKGSFIITWERPSKLEDGNAAKNLKVWRTLTAEQVVSFVQKSQTGWNLQYTFDEKYCARVVTNTVQFFDSTNMNEVWQNLRVEGVTDFQLSPGENNHIAVFVPEKKGMPAKVQVFAVPKFDSPISQKSFFKSDKIQFKWNAAGTALLFLTQTEVDKSGKSYYGETTLYLMNIKTGSDSRVSLDKEGPVHDVTWSPNSKEFGVVYGYMPAKTTIFDTQANAVHNLPLGPRNTVLFSPHGKFIIVAGFGNLTGQMDIYDREKAMAKLTTIEASNASTCEWSPDGRYIMTATTSPRLRVDNGVKIWYATAGQLMYTEDMTELYHVTWRPQPVSAHPVPSGAPGDVPKPHPSAAGHASATPSKPAGAYRPPHARGSATPLHFKREDEGGAAHVAGSSGLFGNGTSEGANGSGGGGLFGKGRRREIPGATPAFEEKSVPGAAPGGGVSLTGAGADGEQALSKTALKNKKKREAAKKAREAQASQEGAGAPETSEGGGRVQNLRTHDSRGHRRDNSRHRDRSQGAPKNGERHHHNREGSWNHQRNQSPHPGQGGPQRQRSQRQRKDGQNNNQGQAQQPQQQQQGQQQQQQAQPPQQQQQQHGRPTGQTIQTNATLLAPVDGAPQTPVTPGGGGPEEKKQRSLLKKLRAIDDLKMRHANGEKLEDTQMKKIASEEAVRKELENLGWQG